MQPIILHTTVRRMLADVFTPVGIYLRLRDRFRDTILLESADFHAADNSFSFIGIHAIGGIEITDPGHIECKLPGRDAEKISVRDPQEVPALVGDFMQRFRSGSDGHAAALFAQGLYGYSSFDAVGLFDAFKLKSPGGESPDHKREPAIPLMRYRLYQYLIAIDHYKDELFLCENHIAGLDSAADEIEQLIRNHDLPVFPFQATGEETSPVTDEDYRQMVKKGIAACHRGDVFQIVLSRRFQQTFTGDEFNVYRALRSVNPSPYLFYFDYGDYKLMGSSPESQVVVKEGMATVHPIAGTIRRTGKDDEDKALALALENDAKENAEHVMLVDLARNDLSRCCSDVEVTRFRQVQYYSHVIHLVSEVRGRVDREHNPLRLLATTFPAGTLSGAPKMRAVELISTIENSPRGFYGGAIGFIGFNGNIQHAIMIRSFLSRNNTLVYQAGAGIVAASEPEKELQEVHDKLKALKRAIVLASTI